jgi:hypothetical protein
LLGALGLDGNGRAVLPVALAPGGHQLFAVYLAADRSGNGVSPLVPLLV